MLAVIGAMEQETALLVAQLAEPQVQELHGFTLYRGTFRGHRLLVATCGVGKVNAAMLSTILVGLDASPVIFTGVAGALDPELQPGDVVVSSDCLQHDVDVTALGYEPGHVPGEAVAWPADRRLAELALAAARELPDTASRLGRVLSGDSFVADPLQAASLRERFGGSCVEMEGAAVAQVCSRAGVPFVVIRSISDRADGGAKPDFREFTELAAGQSLAVVSGLLERL